MNEIDELALNNKIIILNTNIIASIEKIKKYCYFTDVTN